MRLWNILLLLGFAKTSQSAYLFNLNEDPSESINLADDDSYNSLISEFEETISSLSADFVSPVSLDYTAAISTWENISGIGSWLNSDFEPVSVDQIYTSSSAPHIVFVLVDDWGWNDVGSRSTYGSWLSPTLDKLTAQGVSLSNYYTNELCTPSRASLLTGRYAFKLGLQNDTNDNKLDSELSVNEFTIAQEMKSAGYRTYAIGKWGVGYSTEQNTPTQRGFDYFYGFLAEFGDYWTKGYQGYNDVHENEELITEFSVLDHSYHSAYLYQTKAEDALRAHAAEYADTPLFMYYSLQLVHSPYEAPAAYLSRCGSSTDSAATPTASELNYCGMLLLLDDILANLTCVLESTGLYDNSVLVIASDNGGATAITGSSYPFRGSKGSFFKGGVAATAVIHSPLLDSSVKGTTYDGLVHVTDWLPTLMGLATDGSWSGSYVDADLDGVDVWAAVSTNSTSPRSMVPHLISPGAAAVLSNGYKYMVGLDLATASVAEFVFEDVDDSWQSSASCDLDALLSSEPHHGEETTASRGRTILSGDSFSESLSEMTDSKVFIMAYFGSILLFGLTVCVLLPGAMLYSRMKDTLKREDAIWQQSLAKAEPFEEFSIDDDFKK